MAKLSAIFFILLIFYSCNAPRNNPLDAYSAKADVLIIEGKVENFSPPFVGIPNVSVFWVPGNILVKTNNQGNFNIENIKLQNGLLIFSKTGYLSDSLVINWNDAKKITQNANLNKIPLLDSVNFYSVNIIQNDSTQVEQLDIDAKIVDPDNDIDSAVIGNNQLNFNKKIDFNADEKHYQATISLEELNVKDLEEIVGLNFNIYVYDVFKRKYNVGAAKLTRVIKNSADIISPLNGDTVNASPRLSWNRFAAPYKFTYTVEVLSNSSLLMAAPAAAVYQEENISSDKTFLDVKKTLQPGNYYWTIWVVDEFKNTSRSASGNFYIK